MYHALSGAAPPVGDRLGSGRDGPGLGGGDATGAGPFESCSGVLGLTQPAAELAATLARAVGAKGVVCLGCPLASGVAVTFDRGLVTLSRPPLERPLIELERLLLVVADGHSIPDLEACAAAGVPEVWLFEGTDGVLTSLRGPVGCRYRRRSLILPGEAVRLAGLPEVVVVPLRGR